MTRDPFPNSGLSGEAVASCFVMDCHCHLGSMRQFRLFDSTVEGLIRLMDLMGVDVAAPSSVPSALDGLTVAGNDIVIDAVQRFPRRIFGYACVNPRYEREAAQELERCWAAGLRGIKVHEAQGTPYDDPRYDQVWAFAAAHSMPVLAHTWGKGSLSTLEAHFRSQPGISWILGHGLCGVDRDEYVRVARTYPNVYIDTVYSACPRGLLEYFVAQGGVDKIVWGTDIVFMSGEQQLGKILFAGISAEDKVKILGANALRIFGPLGVTGGKRAVARGR